LEVEKSDVALNALDLLEEPETFEEAFYHLDADHKIKWQWANSKEFWKDIVV
jgi:hypothetical protein